MKHHTSLGFLLAPTMLWATTYHVAVTGNNTNSGLSLAVAWASVQHAADRAMAGDTVLVHPGDHQGFAAMEHSGTADAPIVFLAVGPGVNITSPCAYNGLDGINVEGVDRIIIDGFTVNDMPRTGIRTALSDHVIIRHNTCQSNYKWGILTGFAEHVVIEHNTCSGSEDEHGIYVSNSADDPVIRFNHCFDNHANGIHMNGDVSMGGDGTISDAQVYGNIIHGNGVGGGSGINCDGVVNSLFYNNLLYGNHASGISLYMIDGGAPSTGNKVFNNTILNAADARWCVNITEACTGNQVLNNILINQHPWRGSIVIAGSALDGFVSDHNIASGPFSPDGDATIMELAAWQTLGHDPGSQDAPEQTELFMAPGADYRLLPTALAVDAGTAAVASVVATDLEGTARPQGGAIDIGCYESLAGTVVRHPMEPGQRMVRVEAGLLVAIAPAMERIQVHDMAGRTLLTSTLAGGEGRFILPQGVPVVVHLESPDGTPTYATRLVVP